MSWESLDELIDQENRGLMYKLHLNWEQMDPVKSPVFRCIVSEKWLGFEGAMFSALEGVG